MEEKHIFQDIVLKNNLITRLTPKEYNQERNAVLYCGK